MTSSKPSLQSTSLLCKYWYRYSSPSSSSSTSCSISHFTLYCNFHELAEKYPEFHAALQELQCKQTQEQQQQLRRQQQSSEPYTQHNNISNDAGSSIKFAQITHHYNASLTRALLNEHFQLHLPSLPVGHLCPPIPNRANYVCWLRELLVQSKHDLYRFNNSSAAADDEYAQTGGGGRGGVMQWQCRGIDIGTGVSAIYPLLLTTELFSNDVILPLLPPNDSKEVVTREDVSSSEISSTKQQRHWNFLATDIDPLAIESANTNVKANRLEDRIHVVQVNNKYSDAAAKEELSEATTNNNKGPLFAAMNAAKQHAAFRTANSSSPKMDQSDDCSILHSTKTDEVLSMYPKFDFIMTNPPFYKSLKEAAAPRAGDKRLRTDMSSNECVYTCFDDSNTEEMINGGDAGFIMDIMNDSQFFRHHVTWYSSLVCKKSSLDAIQYKLLTLDGVWDNRGQIRKVEFRQENFEDDSSNDIIAIEEKDHPNTKSRRVRWGIGWTYERAIGRCSVCQVNDGVQSFLVWINVDNDDASDDHAKKCAEDEVLSRLSTYFESKCDISLKCEFGEQLYEDKLMRCVTVVETRFNNSNNKVKTTSASKMTVPSHAHDNINLPIEGHFLIDAFVGSSGICNPSGSYGVQVNLDMYSHTKHGSAIITMLQNQMPGEICRTNRKWRRFLQRNQE